MSTLSRNRRRKTSSSRQKSSTGGPQGHSVEQGQGSSILLSEELARLQPNHCTFAYQRYRVCFHFD